MRETPKLASERTALLRGMARIFGFRVRIIACDEWFYQLTWNMKYTKGEPYFLTKSFTAAKEFLVLSHQSNGESYASYKRELIGEEGEE
jgi:hypothetical protein